MSPMLSTPHNEEVLNFSHSTSRVVSPKGLGEKHSGELHVAGAHVSRSLSFGDQQMKSSTSSRRSECSTSAEIDVSDPLSSPCSAGGMRRSSPTRMTLWDLRVRMRDPGSAEERGGNGLHSPQADHGLDRSSVSCSGVSPEEVEPSDSVKVDRMQPASYIPHLDGFNYSSVSRAARRPPSGVVLIGDADAPTESPI